MREVLFRGKRVDNGEWITGNYIKAGYHWHKYGKHEDWIVTSAIQNGGFINLCGRGAVIPETVGQFTGLTDKNGKKIFEGDIVKHSGIVGVIRFEMFSATFLIFEDRDHAERLDNISRFGEYGLQVVGNIHDNIELLEDKKQWQNSK